MNALRPRAVLYGLCTDFGVTWVLAALLVAANGGFASLSAEDQSAALALSPLMWVLGSLATYLGGFVAGHLATGEELANAFAVGIASTAYSFISILGAPETVPFWMEAAALLVTIPLACAGGLTRAALRKRA